MVMWHTERKGEICRQGFDVETEGKRPLEIPRYRWEQSTH